MQLDYVSANVSRAKKSGKKSKIPASGLDVVGHMAWVRNIETATLGDKPMARKFTKAQIATLDAEGISYQVDGAEIIVAVPYEGPIRDGLTADDIDRDATVAQALKVSAMFPDVGGRCCGWGGWRLRRGHVDHDTADQYCNPTPPAQ